MTAAASVAPPEASLAAVAAAHGLRFGSAVRSGALGDPLLPGLLARECATLTPELEWKWAAIAPTAERHDWAAADRVATFARMQRLRLRGHALLWHRSIPGWAAAELASGEGWSLIADHIRALVRRYADDVDEWDVVNEPIEIGARPDGLRDSPFLAAFRADYVARAFHEAHAVAPRARLFINEYDIEYPLPDQRARRDALLALARSLIAQRVPLHGIGIQAHLDLAKGPLDAEVLRRFVGEVAGMGLGVAVTELDVKERDYIAPAAERDRQVAAHVGAFLSAVLSERAVGSVTCWGISDRLSWLAVTPADRARFPGAWLDGSSPGLNRGLPFDSDGRAKPMRDAIAAALGAPRG